MNSFQRGAGLLVLLCLAGCAAGLSREELLQELQERRAPLIVDVRSQREYDRDHVPGALHIPFTGVSSGLTARGIAKDERLVIYCEHGPRAVLANWSLFLSGFRSVSSLEGHMKGWRESRYPMETFESR